MPHITEEQRYRLNMLLDRHVGGSKGAWVFGEILDILEPPEKVTPIVCPVSLYRHRNGGHLFLQWGSENGALDTFTIEYTPNPNGGKGTARIVEGAE